MTQPMESRLELLEEYQTVAFNDGHKAGRLQALREVEEFAQVVLRNLGRWDDPRLPEEFLIYVRDKIRAEEPAEAPTPEE